MTPRIFNGSANLWKASRSRPWRSFPIHTGALVEYSYKSSLMN
jgi:hypothetical protein